MQDKYTHFISREIYEQPRKRLTFRERAGLTAVILAIIIIVAHPFIVGAIDAYINAH